MFVKFFVLKLEVLVSTPRIMDGPLLYENLKKKKKTSEPLRGDSLLLK